MSSADGARRAVAYLRGPEDAAQTQRATIDAWARRRGVEIRAWELDPSAEGATPIAERPGLLAAYVAIREHCAGILVAANAERFSHDELVAWLIERAALTAGAALETADGSRPLPPTRGHEDVAYSRGALELARAHERVVFRQRVRAALAAKRARGERTGNVRYGYRLADDGVHLEPDPREQAVIEAVRSMSGEGLSQRAIVARLAAQGIVGRTGAPLGQTQVATLLRARG